AAHPARAAHEHSRGLEAALLGLGDEAEIARGELVVAKRGARRHARAAPAEPWAGTPPRPTDDGARAAGSSETPRRKCTAPLAGSRRRARSRASRGTGARNSSAGAG